MPSGYVALLDVLGFSSLVAARGEAGVAEYRDCLRRANEATNVSYVVFSDSIVLTAEGEAPDVLEVMVRACSRLMRELVMQNIPIRGAISRGEFLKSLVGESVFVAGRAVIDAYRFEQAQDWIGIMIAPSAVERVPDLDERCSLTGFHTYEELEHRLGWAAHVQRCRRIPFHKENPLEDAEFDGYAVVPTSGGIQPAAVLESIRATIARLNWLRAIAPNPATQIKYMKAIHWLSELDVLWQGVERFREQVQPRGEE